YVTKQQPWYVILKNERKRRNWTQAILAEKIGCDTKTIRRWERGEVFPGPHMRQQLVDAFGMSVELLGLFAVSGIEESAEPELAQLTSWKQDWSDAPNVEQLLGREKEAALASEWITEDACHMVTVVGIGGVGKTTFATTIARNLQHSFGTVYWRSLQHAPSVERFL